MFNKLFLQINFSKSLLKILLSLFMVIPFKVKIFKSKNIKYLGLVIFIFVIIQSITKSQVTGDKPIREVIDTNMLKELKLSADSLMQTIENDTLALDTTTEEISLNSNQLINAYNSFFKKEKLKSVYVMTAFLESMDNEDYSKLLPMKNRGSLISAPFGAKLKHNVVSLQLPKTDKKRKSNFSIPPTSSKYFSSDSSFYVIIDYYKRKYGLDFKVHSYLPEGSKDSMQVARSVKKMKNSIVSIIVWNPTFSSESTQGSKKGKGKSLNKVNLTKLSSKTSIAIQETAFRSNDTLIVEGPDAMVEFTWKVPYRDLIQRAAIDFQIDPFLIACLIQQESNFSNTACSVDSAMGLTQMIGPTAIAMGVTDPTDPKQSIYGGVKYLKLMLRKFEGNIEYALAAYNAGPGNVIKYGGVPPFDETRDYVKRIMTRYREKVSGRWVSPSIRTKI